MPMVTLSVPVVLVLFIIFLGVGGGLTYAALNLTGGVVEPTEGPTATLTSAPTLTVTPELPTATNPPVPTSTPSSYEVKSGDSCSGIAGAFDVSITSIILENGLSANCDIYEGMVLKIPAPTPTVTPIATNTLGSREATIAACEKEYYVVQEGDSLSLISSVKGVAVEHIMEWSGKTVNTAFVGETLIIPLCMREYVGSSTVTPSPAPPYPAPELLLPRNGEAFSLENDTVTLQWASVGTLRENEFYFVTVIDITAGQKIELTQTVKDTKFIVPINFRPTNNQTHIYMWSVVPVAQIGVDEDGNPQYRDGGARSVSNYFSWIGGPPQPTAEP
ncbi:MAG: LysM peptidoglycan-binding domain-containing protein [Anaerolineales bacterium]